MATVRPPRGARQSRPRDERSATLAPRRFRRQYPRLFRSHFDEAARRRSSPQSMSGRNCNMSDWKVLYRDDLDRDRTSRSISSREAALKQARDLYRNQRAEIYRVEGPDGQTLPKEVIMRWVSANKR